MLKYAPALEKQFRQRKRPVGTSWRLDETYVEVKGQWKYLFRALDKAGQKEERPSPPLRTADLLMKIVQRSLSAESVDVLSFLVEEVRKWDIIIQVRRPITSRKNGELGPPIR